MTDDPDTQTVTPPEVELTPIELDGQPDTDKGYVTANGTKIRARVVISGIQKTRAPTNGVDVAVAPSGVNLSLSLAELNDDLTVARDAQRAFLISDRHEIVWHDVSMQNAAFDPHGDMERALRQQAYLWEQRTGNRAAVANYLTSQWGGALAPGANSGSPPLTPAISSQTVAEILGSQGAAGAN